MNISECLSKLMDEKAISDYRLAKDIGVHATTIKNWKDGVSPTIEHAKKLSDYFGVPLEKLLA